MDVSEKRIAYIFKEKQCMQSVCDRSTVRRPAGLLGLQERAQHVVYNGLGKPD